MDTFFLNLVHTRATLDAVTHTLIQQCWHCHPCQLSHKWLTWESSDLQETCLSLAQRRTQPASLSLQKPQLFLLSWDPWSSLACCLAFLLRVPAALLLMETQVVAALVRSLVLALNSPQAVGYFSMSVLSPLSWGHQWLPSGLL